MNKEEFTRQFTRLADQWKGTYSPDRVTLIWDTVKGLPADHFKNLIDNFVGSFRQAPLVPEFQIAVAAYRERTKSFDNARWDGAPRSSCQFCFGLGVYICSGPKGEDFAFRCHCPDGLRDPRQKIPFYKQAHADQGYAWRDVRKAI